MSRQNLIAGNWKLNLSIEEGAALAQAIADHDAGSAEVAVFPTALSVPAALAAADGKALAVGVQNVHWEQSGAFTGELSADLAAKAGCDWVLIGHSERRQYFGETDETCAKRVAATLESGLKPMLCIGETLEEREGGKLEAVLEAQVSGGLAGQTAETLKDLVVAYEPVWAIGTGVVASEEQAQEAHAFVRSLLRKQFGDFADSVRILYGGSVKPDNAAGLLSQEDIDGALVGGASLKPDLFIPIIDAAK